MSNSLRPLGLQHARPSCPSPTRGVYSNSCPLSWWCHPTISSSVVKMLKQHLMILQAGVLEWGAIAFSEGIEVPSKCPLLHQPRHTVTLKSVIKKSLGSCPMSSFWTFSFPHKIDQYKPSTWESPKALMYYSWVFHSLQPKESHCPLWSTFFFFFKMNCGFRFCFFNFCACSVAQLCPTLCNSMDCNPPGSSVHGIFQAEYWSGCHSLLQGIFLTQG